MRYFELTQDRKLRNLAAIEGFQNCPDIVMDRERADSFKRCTNMYVNGDEKIHSLLYYVQGLLTVPDIREQAAQKNKEVTNEQT